MTTAAPPATAMSTAAASDTSRLAAITTDDTASGPSAAEIALLASVFVIAACGLVYELAAGTLASYLLGDSVLQFSTIIGTYLFAMGVGSWLSRYIERQLAAQFLRIELLVGVIGGLMPAILFIANAVAPSPFRGCSMGWCCWSACSSGWKSRW